MKAKKESTVNRPTQLNNEVLVEHFGFFPLAFVDDVINAVNDLIYQAANSLEKFVEEEIGQGEETMQGMVQVETLLESAVDKNFDFFELYVLRNILAIPQDVKIQLAHHKGRDYDITEEEERVLDEELEDVRRKLLTQKFLNHRLHREKAVVSKRLDRLHKCQLQLETLSALANGHNIAPLHDTLRFVNDQIGALKATLQIVREDVNSSDIQDLFGTPSDREKWLQEIVSRQITAAKGIQDDSPKPHNNLINNAEVERELSKVKQELGDAQVWRHVDEIISAAER